MRCNQTLPGFLLSILCGSLMPVSANASLIGATADYCISLSGSCAASFDLSGSLGPIDADDPELSGEVIAVSSPAGQLEVGLDIEANIIGIEIFWSPEDPDNDPFTLPAFQLMLSNIQFGSGATATPFLISALEIDDVGEEIEAATLQFSGNMLDIVFPSVDLSEEELDQIEAFYFVEGTRIQDPNNGGGVPVPSSIALIGVGLVGLRLLKK